MGLALFKERRLTDRRKLTGLLPGRLVDAVSRVDIICRPVDVSANGMGIVVTSQKKEIDPGTELLLLLQSGPVLLQVAWGQPDFGKQDLFRYGLVAVDPAANVEELFIRTGCLK